jgi:hypothetical protein
MCETATTPRKCKKCPVVTGCSSRCPLHLKKEVSTATPLSDYQVIIDGDAKPENYMAAGQDTHPLAGLVKGLQQQGLVVVLQGPINQIEYNPATGQEVQTITACPVTPVNDDVIDAQQYASFSKGKSQGPVVLGLDMASSSGSYTAGQYSTLTGEDGSRMVVQYAGDAASMIALAAEPLQGYTKAAEDAAALELVRTLKSQQAQRSRMVAVVGQGTVGRRVVGYLLQRGIAAIALGNETVPAHLREGLKELPLEQVAVLATQVPETLQELQQAERAIMQSRQAGRALQGIQAALQQPRPKSAKQLAKEARREENKQRTLAGQQRALAKTMKPIQAGEPGYWQQRERLGIPATEAGYWQHLELMGLQPPTPRPGFVPYLPGATLLAVASNVNVSSQDGTFTATEDKGQYGDWERQQLNKAIIPDHPQSQYYADQTHGQYAWPAGEYSAATPEDPSPELQEFCQQVWATQAEAGLVVPVSTSETVK